MTSIIKKIVLLPLLLLLFFRYSDINAGEYIGVGGHAGLQYDVGNLSGQKGADFKGQHNVILGVTLKLDRDPLFFRTGADRTLLLAKGEVLNNSIGTLESVNIQYTSIPLYAGLNFRIRDRGKFYIGFGIVYIMGSGEVKTTAEKVKINETDFGTGFLTGVQLRVGNNTRVFAEWEYISGRTKPVINTSSTNTWKDFSVDYTGHRIYIGASYYIL
jgi:opacity protein-like surface antigen